MCRNPYEKGVINFKDATCWNPIECRPRLFGVRNSQHVSPNALCSAAAQAALADTQAAQVLLEGIELWDPIYWNLHIIQSDWVSLVHSACAACTACTLLWRVQLLLPVCSAATPALLGVRAQGSLDSAWLAACR